jgi:hypothetical protein
MLVFLQFVLMLARCAVEQTVLTKNKSMFTSKMLTYTDGPGCENPKE